MEIALDQCGPATERRLAIIDKNRDLYLTSVRVFGTERKSNKLGRKTESCLIKAHLYLLLLNSTQEESENDNTFKQNKFKQKYTKY